MATRRSRPVPPAPRVSALIESRLHELGRGETAPATVAAYRRDLVGIARRIAAPADVGMLKLRDLSKDALRAAFASWAADHSDASVRRAHSSWSGFFDFLVAEDVCEGNPMAAVPKPPPPAHPPRAIRDPDAPARLLATAARADPRSRDPWPERDLALVAVFCVTGIRAGEAVALDVSSLRGPAADRHLAVVGRNGDARSLPAGAALADALDVYLGTRALRFPSHQLDDSSAPLFVDVRGRRLSADQIRYIVARLFERAGLGDLVPPGALLHALRHTFAVSAARAGADLVRLQALLGHSSAQTTRRYIEASADDLRPLVDGHPIQVALRQQLQAQASDDAQAERRRA